MVDDPTFMRAPKIWESKHGVAAAFGPGKDV
jgi:hypothetical protein